MNQEKIESAALKMYPEERTGSWYHTSDLQRSAFEAGVDYAAANPDVIGCCKIIDAIGYFEWRQSEAGMIAWENTDGDDLDLYQIYQQQKQQG